MSWLLWLTLLCAQELPHRMADPVSLHAEAVLASFASEPSAGQSVAWALEVARIDPDRVLRWLRDARSFGALPEFRVEAKTQQNTGFNWDVPKEMTLVDPVLSKSNRTSSTTVTVRAAWDLGEMLMSSEQIRAIHEGQDAVRLRERVGNEVIRLYYERRALQVEMMLSPPVDVQARLDSLLRLEKLQTSLDAWTGGRFSAALSGGAVH